MRRVELLFDAIRSPYDIAHIIQIARSIDAISKLQESILSVYAVDRKSVV